MRKPSPSEIRLDELCALRRPLTDSERDEVVRLKRTICNTRCQRQRYRRDPEYRETIKRRNLARYHEGRA